MLSSPSFPLLRLLCLLLGVALSSSRKVDVCVLGAGASGMFAAQTIKDAGKTVRVLERREQAGGNCRTYNAPLPLPNQINSPVLPVPMGVVVFPNVSFMRDQLERYDVPVIDFPFVEDVIKFTDFRTGLPVNLTQYSDEEVFLAISKTLQILQTKYPFVFDTGAGYPDVVPPELQVPFREFLITNNIEAVYRVYQLTSIGYASLDIPAHKALTLLRPEYLSVFSPGGGLFAGSGVCDVLYQRMSAFLNGSMIFNAQIRRVLRNNDVTILYRQPDSPRTRVLKCRRLIVAYDQNLATLSTLNLDNTERNVFSRLRNGTYATSLIKFKVANPALVPSSNINVREDPPFNFPILPANVVGNVPNFPFGPLGGFYYTNFQFVNPAGFPSLTQQQIVERMFIDNVVLGLGNVIPNSTTLETYEEHQFDYSPSSADLADGFWGKVRALQGYRLTWYTGSTVVGEAHLDCWAHGKRIADAVVASL